MRAIPLFSLPHYGGGRFGRNDAKTTQVPPWRDLSKNIKRTYLYEDFTNGALRR